MRAVIFDSYGPPDVLQLSDVPVPDPGPGLIRIRVRAAAVNPFDDKQRSGMMAGGAAAPEQPIVPGLEAAGVADRIGDGVSGVEVGDEVFGLGAGTYAEYAVLRAWAPKPANLSWEQAAGLAVAGETSVRAISLLRLRPGQDVTTSTFVHSNS